jgi:hypothetical protein
MALLVFSVVVVCVAVAGLVLSWADSHAQRPSADHDACLVIPPPLGTVHDPYLVITPPLGTVVVAPDRDGGREEMTLARQLTSGDLTPARYQQQMADLAAWDASAHPLVVPSDRGA